MEQIFDRAALLWKVEACLRAAAGQALTAEALAQRTGTTVWAVELALQVLVERGEAVFAGGGWLMDKEMCDGR